MHIRERERERERKRERGGDWRSKRGGDASEHVHLSALQSSLLLVLSLLRLPGMAYGDTDER
jgi:hypothetical protein